MKKIMSYVLFSSVSLLANLALAFSGQVTTVDPRGWGFITPTHGGERIFFHKTDVNGRDVRFIREGTCVTYHLNGSGKDLKAIAVQIDDYNDCNYSSR